MSDSTHQEHGDSTCKHNITTYMHPSRRKKIKHFGIWKLNTLVYEERNILNSTWKWMQIKNQYMRKLPWRTGACFPCFGIH